MVTSRHGPIGLPLQRVRSGTNSPRITSEAGPTVAWAPIRAAGRMTLCGPMVAPGVEDDGVHAHDSIMEEVGLHNAARG